LRPDAKIDALDWFKDERFVTRRGFGPGGSQSHFAKGTPWFSSEAMTSVRHGRNATKFRKSNLTHQSARKPDKANVAKSSFPPRWATIALCVLLAGGGSWAVFEFFIWAKLPPALVGKWIVHGGPQDGAIFDFSRRGSLEAHLHDHGMDRPLYASVAVEDKNMFVTTRNPHTKQNETRTCSIRELTATSLIVEFEKGEVYKMERAE
jgi:hypothetical protein